MMTDSQKAVITCNKEWMIRQKPKGQNTATTDQMPPAGLLRRPACVANVANPLAWQWESEGGRKGKMQNEMG